MRGKNFELKIVLGGICESTSPECYKREGVSKFVEMNITKKCANCT